MDETVLTEGRAVQFQLSALVSEALREDHVGFQIH